MKNIPIVNIFNIVRMSHESPSKFYIDDLETFENQLIATKYYGLPATFALKYDALMDIRYREVIQKYKDEKIEFAFWLEVTEDMIEGDINRDSIDSEKYSDRINSLYIIGYDIDTRKKIVDQYMSEYYKFFNHYPNTIASWVLDEQTVTYAIDKYNISSIGICRDQLSTDGFSLYGGHNGIYFPSKNNLFFPSNSRENQLNVSAFRIISPDPIYNFEIGVRDNLFGVYTLEPASITGRGEMVDWYFSNILDENCYGVNYLQIGQENNFLWENIRSGYLKQLEKIYELAIEKKIIVKTMGRIGDEFLEKFKLTPKFSQLIKRDWKDELQTFWINTRFYRLSILKEKNRCYIRDFFMYRDDYKSQFSTKFNKETVEIFALPILFPQYSIDEFGRRPFIKILDENNQILEGDIKVTNFPKYISLEIGKKLNIIFTDNTIKFIGNVSLVLEALPGCINDKIELNFNNYNYSIEIENVKKQSENKIENVDGEISLIFDRVYESEKEAKFNFEEVYINNEYIESFRKISKEIKYVSPKDANIIYPNRVNITNKIDTRPIFNTCENKLFFYENIGSLDFLDGNWMATKGNFDIEIDFDSIQFVDYIEIGFLFNHRQGIIFPKKIVIEIQDDEFSINLENLRPNREIAKENFKIKIARKIGKLKIKTLNYEIMPKWAFYYGSRDVFNLIDRIYIYA